MSSYALVADLYVHGAPLQAFQVGGVAIPSATLQAELDAVSALADEYIGPRGQLPLLAPYPTSLTMAVCKIAAYNILSVRGLNPSAGADSNLRVRHDDGMRWLDDVRTQRVTPLFIYSPDTSATHQQPMVISSSVVQLSTGCTGPNRGW